MARVPDNQRFLPVKKEKNGAQQDQCYCRDEPSLSNEVHLSHREIEFPHFSLIFLSFCLRVICKCCGSILSLVQILFLLFLGIAKYDSEFETKENIIRTKDKIEPQHIQGLRLQPSQ